MMKKYSKNKLQSHMNNNTTLGYDAEDFIVLNEYYLNIIRKWLAVELPKLDKDKSSTSKLNELLTVNLKVMATDTEDAAAMRFFFFNKVDPELGDKSTDHLMNRILDLYVMLTTSLPPEFIEWKREVFYESLLDLDMEVALEYEVLPVMVDIQFTARYLMV